MYMRIRPAHNDDCTADTESCKPSRPEIYSCQRLGMRSMTRQRLLSVVWDVLDDCEHLYLTTNADITRNLFSLPLGILPYLPA